MKNITKPQLFCTLQNHNNLSQHSSLQNNISPETRLKIDTKDKMIIFHNGSGPMCRNFLNFAETINYPLEEHLFGENGFWEDLDKFTDDFNYSEGLSNSFSYLPIIFIRNKAFSGFDQTIEKELIDIIANFL